jgi:hypothetical protein
VLFLLSPILAGVLASTAASIPAAWASGETVRGEGQLSTACVLVQQHGEAPKPGLCLWNSSIGPMLHLPSSWQREREGATAGEATETWPHYLRGPEDVRGMPSLYPPHPS